MTSDGPPSRRQVLATLAGLTGIAGCSEADTTAQDRRTSSAPLETTTASEPALILPSESLIDEAVTLRFQGMSDVSEFEVRAETTDTQGTIWRSRATVRATGGSGSLDDATLIDAAFEPSLSVGHTMALLQFLAPVGEPARYLPRSEERVSITVSANGSELTSTALTRYHGARGVTASTPGTDAVAGTLYEPASAGPSPGVIVLHASDGRPDTFLAKMLASHGFTALALRYFGQGAPTEQLYRIPISYVETAIDWIREQPTVTDGRVGLVGDSRGGELALLAGSEFETVGPVVSRNGSGLVWPGFSSDGFNAGSTWTQNGTDVPFVPYVEDPDLWSEGPLEPAYTESLERASDAEVSAATIPVEEINGPILFVSGGQDTVWDATRLQNLSVDRLEAAGRSDYNHVVFQEAGHVTTIPYRPISALEARTVLQIGGTPAGHARASAGHWPYMLDTLSALR